MQPDTTALKLARDITAKLSGEASSEQLQNNKGEEIKTAQTQPLADTSPSAMAPESQVQVVPLYTPAGAAIKFFCVHPSHRYALNLVPISTGFQGQVIPYCCIMYQSVKSTSKENILRVCLLKASCTDPL